MVESGQWLFPMRGGELYPDKPPVFMWAIALFLKATGSLRVAFLLPSLLAGLGTVALVFDLARRLHDRAAAWRTGLLLLLTIQFTLQARTAQIDGLVTFFITLGVYGFLRFLLLGGGWRWYYLGWFAAGLGVITKGVGILALFVLVPALYHAPRRDPACAARGLAQRARRSRLPRRGRLPVGRSDAARRPEEPATRRSPPTATTSSSGRR